MNIRDICGYCQCDLLVPHSGIHKLVDKYANIFNKRKCIKAMRNLNYIVNISNDAKDYVKYRYPNIDVSINNNSNKNNSLSLFEFLEDKSAFISIHIHCNNCKKECCEFHYNYGNNTFHKCSKCSKNIMICGYCMDEINMWNRLNANRTNVDLYDDLQDDTSYDDVFEDFYNTYKFNDKCSKCTNKEEEINNTYALESLKEMYDESRKWYESCDDEMDILLTDANDETGAEDMDMTELIDINLLDEDKE